MKAAVLHAYDTTLTQKQFVSYETVPDPVIEKPTDVIVRIGGAGVCRTDLHIVEGCGATRPTSLCPTSWVTRTPAGSRRSARPSPDSSAGDPVICHPLVTSGHCLACRRGNDMHAVDSRFPGINANGGYAEFLLSGERALIKLPKRWRRRTLLPIPTPDSPPTAPPRRHRATCYPASTRS